MFNDKKIIYIWEFFIGFTLGLLSLISNILVNISVFGILIVATLLVFKDKIEERWVEVCTVIVGFIMSNLLTYGIFVDYIIKRSG